MEGTALYVRCDAALTMRRCVTCDTLCIGTRVILEAFRDAGVAVEQLVVAGGLVKNSILMQIYRRTVCPSFHHAHASNAPPSATSRVSLSPSSPATTHPHSAAAYMRPLQQQPIPASPPPLSAWAAPTETCTSPITRARSTTTRCLQSASVPEQYSRSLTKDVTLRAVAGTARCTTTSAGRSRL